MTWLKKRIGWLCVIAVLLFAGGFWLPHEIRIDKCLDAGGAWDYQAEICKMPERK